MRPILFQIGDFRFYSFGLMAALALIVPGMTIVRPLVRRRGVPSEFAYELIIAAGIGGFVFARIYYLIENYALIKADFWSVAFGGVGFVWYGGLIGGFLGVVGWTLIRRYPLDVIANAMAPATAFGYLIGRIGCQLAGDGDYGKVEHAAVGHGLSQRHRADPARREVHPTPIYEIIAMAFVVWILWRLATRYDKSGWWTFGWFLVLSGVERFLVEFVRINPVWFWHLTQPQWVSIVSVAHRRHAHRRVRHEARRGRRRGRPAEPRGDEAGGPGLLAAALAGRPHRPGLRLEPVAHARRRQEVARLARDPAPACGGSGRRRRAGSASRSRTSGPQTSCSSWRCVTRRPALRTSTSTMCHSVGREPHLLAGARHALAPPGRS